MATPGGGLDIDPEQQRRLAAELFNHVWELLGTEDRTRRRGDLMIHAAHASRYLWEEVGGPTQHAMDEWQVHACVPCWGGPSRRCSTRAGAWRSARRTGSLTSTWASPLSDLATRP